MNIAPWTDVPFDDDDAFSDFTLALGLNHTKIAQVMFSQSKFYQTYPLKDGSRDDRGWLLDLQTELGSIYFLNNLTGLPDFSGVNLKKDDEFEDFMLQLQQVEATINQTLGITG